MTGAAPEWSGLAQIWAGDVPPAELQRTLVAKVRRHTRLMWLVTATELLLLAGLAWFTLWAVTGGATALRVILLAVVWTISLFTLAFSLWNRRGNWRPSMESPSACVALMERRAHAKIRAARFVRPVAVLQAAAVLLLVLERFPDASPKPVLEAVAACALLIVAYFAWSVLYERRAHAELRGLHALRRLAEPDESP